MLNNLQRMSHKGELIFLGSGTSQGIPVIGCYCSVCDSANPRDNRTRSSVHIHFPELSLHIDTGPDFRLQMLREKLTHIDAVLFTHEHQDHIAGLDDVRPIIFRVNKELALYGQERVLNRVKKAFHYAFETLPYPGAPRFATTTIKPGKSFSINGIQITPIGLNHGNLPILGYRIGDVAYLTDVNYIPHEAEQQLTGLNYLILDALHRKLHHSHFNLDQAITWAKRINAKHTYFIHMSHYMGKHEEVERELPERIYLSYDGLRIPVNI